MALGFPQVVRGRTRGGVSPSGGLHPRPPPAIERRPNELVHRTDRNIAQGSGGSRGGARKQLCKGRNGSVMQPSIGMRVLPRHKTP
jgi:hypothetical protein